MFRPAVYWTRPEGGRGRFWSALLDGVDGLGSGKGDLGHRVEVKVGVVLEDGIDLLRLSSSMTPQSSSQPVDIALFHSPVFDFLLGREQEMGSKIELLLYSQAVRSLRHKEETH